MLLLEPHFADSFALSGLFDAGSDQLGLLFPVLLQLVLLAARLAIDLVRQVVTHGLLLHLLEPPSLLLLFIEQLSVVGLHLVPDGHGLQDSRHTLRLRGLASSLILTSRPSTYIQLLQVLLAHGYLDAVTEVATMTLLGDRVVAHQRDLARHLTVQSGSHCFIALNLVRHGALRVLVGRSLGRGAVLLVEHVDSAAAKALSSICSRPVIAGGQLLQRRRLNARRTLMVHIVLAQVQQILRLVHALIHRLRL